MEVIPNQTSEFSWPHRTIGREGKHSSRSQKSNIHHLFLSGNFFDAVLCVEGVKFHVHRNILACSSDYFRALFTVNLQGTHGSSKGTYQKREGATPDSTSSDKPTQATKICFTSNIPSTTSSVPVASHENASPNPIFKARNNNHRRSSRYSKTPSYLDATCKVQAQSKYFKTKQMRRSQVTLCDVSARVMQHILEHIYGGNVTLTIDNVEQILTAADRFQVTSLVQKCSDFLSNHLSIQNCVSMIQLSTNIYGCTTLRVAARLFLLEHFEIIYKTSLEFVHLTASELRSFLADDHLNIRKEETILDAVVKWVAADQCSREVHISSLAQCARVGSFLPVLAQGLIPSIPCYDDVASAGTMHDITSKVMRSVLERQQHMQHSDFAMFVPRLPRDVMFVIGGSNFGYPLGIVEVFDSRTWNWHDIGACDFVPRSYHGVAQVGKSIFVVGGFDGQSYLSSCCRFCPETSMVSWECVTPMHTKRCYVGVVHVQGILYAVGGYDGAYRLSSAERFDPKTNQWSFISPMAHHRSDAGIAVLDDKIYVCGGFSGSECIKTMEMYDADQEEWIPQPSMPNGRSGLGVVAYNGCLYAVGGFNGVDSSVRLSSMESFNPQTKQWTTLSPMPHPRSNLAVSVMENTMYAIGGYNGVRTSAVVECYNFETDTWYQTTRLSQSRSALSVCVLSCLSNTASILGRESVDCVDDQYNDDDYNYRYDIDDPVSDADFIVLDDNGE